MCWHFPLTKFANAFILCLLSIVDFHTGLYVINLIYFLTSLNVKIHGVFQGIFRSLNWNSELHSSYSATVCLIFNETQSNSYVMKV
jgi:hypothetical protein